MPPPPLHTRSTNETWDPQPSTDWNTPSSSPVKGSTTGGPHLAELFDKSLQLTPTASPQKTPPTPTKRLQGITEYGNDTSIIRSDGGARVPRERRKTKEQLALERDIRGAIHTKESSQTTRRKYDPFRDMTADEIEKLTKPSVKRLKDVAHLCKSASCLRRNIADFCRFL